MNKKVQEIIKQARLLDRTTDTPIYCQKWGEIESGRYAGRGNPNGMLIKYETQTFAEQDWDAAAVKVEKYLKAHGVICIPIETGPEDRFHFTLPMDGICDTCKDKEECPMPELLSEYDELGFPVVDDPETEDGLLIWCPMYCGVI